MKNINKKPPKLISPFHIHSIIGFNLKVPIINVTSSEEQPMIAYASGHILTILDCENNGTEYLLGHERDIVSIGTARACKVLVTSDEHLVNIWERRESKNGKLVTVLLKSFNNPLIEEPFLSTGLSVDGEYLVLASQGHIQLWILRNGHDAPDAIYELPDNLRIGSKIVFCKSNNQSNSFVVTTETNLLFCKWNVERSVIEAHSPKLFPGVSQIVDSSYCTNYCKGISITHRSAIVWSDTQPGREFKPNLFKNRMEFRSKMKLGFYQLNTVSCCNEFIIISDGNGDVKFYDENMKFCFSYEIFGQIVCSISFVDRKNVNGENQFGCKDSSCMGPFFFSSENGRIFKCNLNSKPTLLCESAPVFMTCFDLHPKKKFLCGGRNDGSIFMYDYSTSTYDKYLSLPLELSKQLKLKPEPKATSCLNFSSCGRYIAAGMTNGYLAILNTVTFTLFQKVIMLAEANVAIEKVIFSEKNELIVYRDASCTVGLLHFKSSWKLSRKIRVHDSDIAYMSIRESDYEIGLVTISEDYSVADYTIRKGGSGNAIDLLMNNCERIDFLSVLKCGIKLKRNIIAFPNCSGNDDAFLTTDEKFKYQIRNIESLDVINTFAAPIAENEPITMMCHVHRKKENAIAFSNKNIIGLQHLPIDGNPNKYLAMVGHPRKIRFMKVSHCNKYLFTIGEDDPSVYIWKIKISAVRKQYQNGGTSLRPFCNLIPDGVNGKLFTEMQDLFFYIQIKLHKEHSNELKDFKLTDGIPVSEAIDFLRGIGFFPSGIKIEYIMKEMEFYTNNSEIITFENLVKLFVNYRPPFGYLKAEIHQTVKYLGYSYTMESADTEITRERLVEICTSIGEEMDENEAAMFLNRLDGQDETDEESEGVTSSNPLFNKIRKVYTIPEFVKYILGFES